MTKLIDSLAQRYGPTALGDGAPESDLLRSKEALRQIGLMFSLLGEYQPVDAITQILAACDDARIEKVVMMDGGTGYPPPAYAAPKVTFPAPPTMAGTTFEGAVAQGQAVMQETGKLWRIEVTRGGQGYTNPPLVQISYPVRGDVRDARVRATARAYLGKKKRKGSVERIEVLDPGAGYTSLDDIVVAFAPPDAPPEKGGAVAAATALLEHRVAGVEVTAAGAGYAAEKAVNVVIDPPPPSAAGDVIPCSAFAVSYPTGKSTSYQSFVGSGTDGSFVSNVDATQWATGPTSSQLLALLPSGFGLQYDDVLERYILSRYDASSNSNSWDDVLGGSLEGQKFKPLNPIVSCDLHSKSGWTE